MKRNFKKLTAAFMAVCLTLGVCGVNNILSSAEETPAVTDGIPIDETNIPNMSAHTQARYADNTGNKDNILSPEEALKVTSLTILEESDMANLPKYLQMFPALTSLSVECGNQKSIPVGDNTTFLSIRSTYAGVVDILGGKKLKTVSYSTTQKTKLNFKKAKGYSNITSIWVSGKKVNDIVLPNQNNLQEVDISGTGVSKIDISKCKKLTAFQCYYGKLKTLNISANKNLKDIGANGNKITKLDTSKNKKLECVVINENKIKSIDVKKNKKLNRLEVAGNKLKTIDTSKNSKLETLNVGENKLKSLNVTKNKKLTTLWFNDNQINKLQVKKNNKISSLFVGGNKFKTFPLSNYKKVTAYDVGSSYSLLKDFAFNDKLTLYISVSKKKTQNLKKYLPKMKKCTFQCAWENPDYYTLSSDGVLNFTSAAKKLKYTSYASLKVLNGNKTMMLYVKY